MKTILVLGSGLVSPPLVRYFLPRREVRLVIASLDFSRIEKVAAGHDRVSLVATDVGDQGSVRALVRDADVAISILPAPLLPDICRIAIAERTPLVSTSYADKEVQALDGGARAAGVLLLNETGFDPGIDHMAAMRTIDSIRRAGGTVTRYMSGAGGLPAPESNNNPWGYKFSWSPRGVVLAARNDARFLRDGEVVHVSGFELVEHCSRHEIAGLGEFEMYPNRDALRYRDLYGLDDARDVYRGTIRYPGWCATMAAATSLGFFDMVTEEWPPGTTWGDLVSRKAPSASSDDVASFLGVRPDSHVMTCLRWAGLLGNEPVGALRASPLDLFVSRLEALLRYEPGERDMAVLQHAFEAAYPDGRSEEMRSDIIAFGEADGDTAMSRLVALPAAIAANLILEGRVDLIGAQIPLSAVIYEPVLEELETLGVEFT